MEHLFAGDSEIAELVRSHLDTKTVWSVNLQNVFGILLNASCPMFVVWDGRDRPEKIRDCIFFYNDAYLALLRTTHLHIPFGTLINDSWPESWADIRADIDHVFATGRSHRREPLPFPPNPEDTDSDVQYSWAYSPLWSEDGWVQGVFATGSQVSSPPPTPTRADMARVESVAGEQGKTAQTSLQQTEAALRESEARFQAFMSHSPMAAWIADQSGCLLYLSPTYTQTFQLPQQDTVGQRIRDVYSEEFAQQFLENNRSVFNTGQVIETIETAPRVDGSIGNFLVYKFPIVQESGEMLLGGIAIDITERKQTEETLQRREEELRLVTDALPVLIAYVDKDHYYRFNNQTYETWFGRPAASFTGKHVREILGDEGYEIVRPYMERALSGERVRFESQVPYRNNGVCYINADYVPDINNQGEIQGYFSLVSDASDRRRIEIERREAEADRERLLLELAVERSRFEAVLRQMPEGVMIADAASEELILSNARASQILRHSFENHLELEAYDQRVPFNVYHPDGQEYKPEEYPLVRSLRAGEVVAHEEMEICYADGGRIVIDANAAPILDSQGHITSAVVLIQDITARKRAEQELRESEQRLQLAQQAGRMGSWEWNLITNQVTWSDGIWTLLVLEPNSFTPDLDTFVQFIHPDDRKQALAEVEIALSKGDVYEGEFRAIRQDGEICWLLSKGKVIRTPEGQPERLLGINVDITARKQTEEALRQSEEQLRLAQRAAGAGLWDWDIVTDTVIWSEEYYELYGLETTIVPSYETWLTSILEVDRDRVDQTARQSLEQQINLNVEFRIVHPQKGLRWLTAIGQTFYGAEGQPIRMAGIALDITQRKQAETEREELLSRERTAREDAERANRIKDEFLAVLSHELRSPLNPILGWAKLLQTRHFDEASTRRALETIERNAKLQTQLIDDLLDVSRILRGKMMLDVCPVDLGTVIDAALETVRLSAEAKNIELQKSIADGVGLVAGDAGRLQQTLWNLLSNAVKFTPGGGRIEICLEEVGTHAQIQVKDTGKGIAPDFLPHVFEYFRQEDGTTTRKFGGLGLGLAIVRYLIEQHGGLVKADSPGEGLGATFTILLPLVTVETTKKVETPSPSQCLAYSSPLNQLRILIVDDEPDMRDLISTILKQAGAETTTVATAIEALNAFTQLNPDVLISDIGMPGVDGYGLIRQIRRLLPGQNGTIPAIALTAYAGELDQEQALAAGFQKHIAKPVEPEALVQAIAALVNRE